MGNKRINDKIEYARERINDLKAWLSEGEIKEKKALFASEKAFQELAESLMDIFAMILSDLRMVVKDDYTNIDKLKEKNILGEDHAGIAIEANGLRNRIVHRYNSVDEKIFVESAKELLPKLTSLLQHLENYNMRENE